MPEPPPAAVNAESRLVLQPQPMPSPAPLRECPGSRGKSVSARPFEHKNPADLRGAPPAFLNWLSARTQGKKGPPAGPAGLYMISLIRSPGGAPMTYVASTSALHS